MKRILKIVDDKIEYSMFPITITKVPGDFVLNMDNIDIEKILKQEENKSLSCTCNNGCSCCSKSFNNIFITIDFKIKNLSALLMRENYYILDIGRIFNKPVFLQKIDKSDYPHRIITNYNNEVIVLNNNVIGNRIQYNFKYSSNFDILFYSNMINNTILDFDKDIIIIKDANLKTLFNDFIKLTCNIEDLNITIHMD